MARLGNDPKFLKLAYNCSIKYASERLGEQEQ